MGDDCGAWRAALARAARTKRWLGKFYDGHLNARGNAVVADAWFDWLGREGLLDVLAEPRRYAERREVEPGT